MKQLITLWTLLIAFTLFSCGSKENAKQGMVMSDLNELPAGQPAKEKVENAAERKIIKEGDISFESADINKTKSLITQSVQNLNGYISKDEAFDYNDRLEHRLVIRVPADKFDILLAKISESTEKLDSKNINVLDVTEEYIDIDSRIKTKKELEERYKELLKQATKVEELLAIEKEIGQLRTEIESVEGRLRYLKDKISLSSLTVTYYQKTHSTFGFSSKFGLAIKSGWDNLLWFFIGLTHIWPFVLIIAAAVYSFIRRYRKKKEKNNI